jgi:glycogen synthase
LQKRLLYYSPSTVGGLADYAHEQANALADSGVAVTMLVTPQRPERADSRYQICAVLNEAPGGRQSTIARKISWVKCLLGNFRALAREIPRQRDNFASWP